MTVKKETGFMFKNTSKSAVKVGDTFFSVTVPAGAEKEIPERLVPSAKLVEAEMKKAASVKAKEQK